MDTDIRAEAAQLSDALVELAEDIDLARDDDATADEIQETKALADEVLARYSALLSRLTEDDKTEVQRSIGLKVAKIEGLLSTLPSSWAAATRSANAPAGDRGASRGGSAFLIAPDAQRPIGTSHHSKHPSTSWV